MENLTDPSHLPFSHHTVLGNRCAQALSGVACFDDVKHNFDSSALPARPLSVCACIRCGRVWNAMVCIMCNFAWLYAVVQIRSGQ